MFLQGRLQTVFDALFELGAIDPALDMDWSAAYESTAFLDPQVKAAFDVALRCQDDLSLMVQELSRFDQKILCYLAMEVGREYVDSSDVQVLH